MSSNDQLKKESAAFHSNEQTLKPAETGEVTQVCRDDF